MFYSTWIRLSYGFFDQFGYDDRYCCIINMNMFIVIFSYLRKCICIFFVPLINLMRYFVIFVMFSIIKHISYHVMVHDWNKKNTLSTYLFCHFDVVPRNPALSATSHQQILSKINLSRCSRKTSNLCETKGVDQPCSTCTTDQRL